MQSLKKSVCRTCLSGNQLRSVFSRIKSDEVSTYSEILIQCTFVQISEDDDMPTNICGTCRDYLYQIYLFKKQCEKADFILRMQIKKEDVETDPLELSVVNNRTGNATGSLCGAKNSLRDFENTETKQHKNLNTYEREKQKMALNLTIQRPELTKYDFTVLSNDSNDCKNDYTDLTSNLFTNKVPLTRLEDVKVEKLHSLRKQNQSIIVSCRMCKEFYYSGFFSQHWAAYHQKKSKSFSAEITPNLVTVKSSKKEKMPSIESASNLFIAKSSRKEELPSVKSAPNLVIAKSSRKEELPSVKSAPDLVIAKSSGVEELPSVKSAPNLVIAKSSRKEELPSVKSAPKFVFAKYSGKEKLPYVESASDLVITKSSGVEKLQYVESAPDLVIAKSSGKEELPSVESDPDLVIAKSSGVKELPSVESAPKFIFAKYFMKEKIPYVESAPDLVIAKSSGKEELPSVESAPDLVISKSSRKEKLPLTSNNQLPTIIENDNSNVLKEDCKIEKINDDQETKDCIQTNEGVVCLKCNEQLQSYNAFEKHLFVKHAETMHNCKKCNTNFIFRESLLQHVKEVHKEQTDEVQESKTSHRNEREQNLTSESPPTEDAEPLQNKEMVKQGNFDVENNESLTDDCNNEETKDIQILKYNKKPDDIQETNHTNESKIVFQTNKWIKCLKCNQLSRSVGAFKIHLFATHNEMSYKCDKCARGFVFHKSLIRHKKWEMCKETVKVPECTTDDRNEKEQGTVKFPECPSNDRNKKEQGMVKVPECPSNDRKEKEQGMVKVPESTADDRDDKEQWTVKIPKRTAVYRNKKLLETVKVFEWTAGEQNTNANPSLNQVDTVDEKLSQNEEMDFLDNDSTPSDITETNEVANESNKGTNDMNTSENIHTWIACVKCNELLQSKNEYERHLYIKHGSRLYKCKECDLDFLFEESFLCHMYKTHGERRANHDGNFLNMRNEEKKKVKCDKCGIEYVNKHSACICCKFCTMAFKKKITLDRHLIKVHKVKMNPCGICGKSCLGFAGIQRHLQFHKKREKVCKVCGQTFKDVADLERHLIKTNERAYRCNVCDKGFNTKSYLLAHSRIHKDNYCPTKYVCEFCGEQYLDRANLKSHIKTFHFGKNDNITYDESRNLFICNICKRGFETEIIAKVHVRRHVLLNKCRECGETFGTRQELASHEISIHNTKLYKCNQCNNYYRTRGGLRIHAVSHDRTIINECNVCMRKFASVTTLRNHMRTHENVKKNRCHFCQKRFLVGANLSTHIRNCHKDESNSTKPVKKYLCTECGKSISEKHTFEEHTNRHKGLTPYDCDKCGKKFPGHTSLYNHRKLWHRSKEVNSKKQYRYITSESFECQPCNKKFRSKDAWTVHMNNHAGIVPYECKICNKRYTTRYQLILHHRTHTGIKPYKCDVCDKAFIQKPHLNTHKELHHSGVKRYVCNYCNKRFTIKQYLRNHLRIHTGETYQCPFCDRKFNHYSNMRKHKLSHKNSDERKATSS